MGAIWSNSVKASTMSKIKTTGGGIVSHTTTSFGMDDIATDAEAKEAWQEFGGSFRWDYSAQPIIDGVVAEYVAKAAAQPQRQWREYQDPEWFALTIAKRWQWVGNDVSAGDANAAAKDAIELGWLIATFMAKLDLEPEWQWGRDKRAAASGGGKSREGKTDRTDAGVNAMVSVLARKPDLTISAAAKIAATQIGKPSSGDAIRAAYNRRRKKLDAS